MTPNKFVWGKIKEHHQIGPYNFIEYWPWNGRLTWDEKGPTVFHIYVDEKDTSIGTNSLDGALMAAVAYKRLGSSEGRASAPFLARCLKLEEEMR